MDHLLLCLVISTAIAVGHAAPADDPAGSYYGPAALAPKPNVPRYDDDESHKCTRIREPICKGLKYETTKMPNWIGMNSQEEAAKRMNDYRSLINIHCSHYLQFFLCTIYFPMCTPGAEPPAAALILKPCKTLCTHVRNHCSPIMEQFNFPWPSDLACDRLPDSLDLCIQPNNYTLDKSPSTDAMKDSVAKLRLLYPDFPNLLPNQNHEGTSNSSHQLNKQIACSPAERRIAYDKNGTCLTYCNTNLLFRESDKHFAEVWTLVWAVLCVVSTALTLLTFAADSSRFRYPERPVVYLAICYFVYSLSFLLRAGLGRQQVACRQFEHSDSSERFLVRAGHEGTWCTIVFLINYYFGMASALWWVMLALTWYLSASRKWGHEGVEAVSSVFHMIAWAIPAIKSIVILIMHLIDADELTGMCSVGNQNRDALLIFIILPLAVYLFIGLVFLGFGFISLLRVRRDLQARLAAEPSPTTAANIRRLEKLIAKILVFSVLYTLPLLCAVGSYAYEFINLPRWQGAVQEMNRSPRLRRECLSRLGLSWSLPHCVNLLKPPSVEVHMLKTFMSLVVGITSGMWVWCNRKSWDSWCRFICRHRFATPSTVKVTATAHVALLPNASIFSKQQPTSSGQPGDSHNAFHKFELPPNSQQNFAYSQRLRAQPSGASSEKYANASRI